MARASTVRRHLTSLLIKAKIVTKTRIAKKRRKRAATINRKSTKAAAPTMKARIAKSLINTKVPVAHQKISIIPAVIVAQSTKAKIKTEIESARKIRTATGVTIRAVRAAQSTRAGIKTASAPTSIRAPAQGTVKSRRPANRRK